MHADSQRHGTQNGEIDFALLVDGLDAEREQGITIDVAYRYFDTDARKFIVADCPGHEQYTRNMATGASTADLAVVLVDARKGLLTQTRRHSYIVSLLGIRHVRAGGQQDGPRRLRPGDRSTRSKPQYRELAGQLGITHVTCIPVSALKGDNMLERSAATPWYRGQTLLGHLESVDASRQARQAGFRLPVQWVCRPNQDFRGFAGTVTSGSIATGDDVVVLPSGRRSKVTRIVTADGDLAQAGAGRPVTLTLSDEIDASRGDVIAAAFDAPEVADQFATHLLWLGEQPLLPGRPYWLKIAGRTVGAQVTEIKHKIDVNTQEELAAKQLELNEVAYCNLYLDQPIAFERYADNPELGGFILIDRQTNATVAAGTLDFSLRRAGNIHWEHVDVDKQARARIKHQKPACLWFTGLSGSGKSTIANLVEKRLLALGLPHLPARRRQRAPRLEQGPRLHRRRSRGEHPPRGGGRQAHGRRRPDRAGEFHLAVPRRAADGARHVRRRRIPSRSSSTRRWRSPSSATSRACTRRRARAQIRNFTGIDSPYEVPGAAR